MKYIAYYRVSSQEQGKSGLGLEAQRATVLTYIRHNGNQIIAEYTEVESGKNDKRPQLLKAIGSCKENDATLVIAKLDRLSRNLTFISILMDTKVRFKCCDMPEADETMIGIMAVFAQRERRFISERTKAALDAKRIREPDWKPGTPNLTDKDRIKAHTIVKSNADQNQNNRHAYHFICPRKVGGMTYQNIAEELNKEGYKTRRGMSFHAMSVYYIWKRFAKEE